MPQTRNVSNAQELAAALASAAGGDTIVLGAGNYGALDLTGVAFASDVTIVSQAPLGAKFTSVRLTNTDHLVFDGIAVAGEFRAWNGSDFVTLANSDVDGTAYFMAATNIVVRSNDITGGMNALIFNDVYHVDVLGNVIHDARSDLLRITGDSSDFDIAYNYLVETHSVAGDHPDMIQLLARNGQTPDNIRIVGNNLYDDPDTGSTPAQGIFFNDAAADGYRHVLIENNIVHSGSANGVYMSGGTENVLIKDNLLTVMPDGSGGSLRIVEDDGNHNRGTTVTGNTVRRILDETSDFSAGIVIENNTFQNVPGSPPTGTPTIGVLPSSPASPPPSPPPPVSPPPAPSGDVQVSNAQELAAALASAPAGGTIVLAAGDYGALNLTGVSFASNVTIKAETALGARFSTVQLSNTDHLAFEGISVSGEFRAWQGSDAISLVNSDVDGGGYFMDAANIYLKGNYITGPMHALIFNDVDHVKVIGNSIHDARVDLLRVTGDSTDVRIAYNHLFDIATQQGDHPDAIQLIGRAGTTPSNVRVVGNIIYDDPNTGTTFAQGVFINDPDVNGYRDILVADNLINVGSPNSIYVNGGVHNVIVRDNVLPVWPDGQGGTIRLVETGGLSNNGTTIQHNLAQRIWDETTDLSADMKVLDNTLMSVPMADLLANWDAHVDASFAHVPHAITLSDLIV